MTPASISREIFHHTRHFYFSSLRKEKKLILNVSLQIESSQIYLSYVLLLIRIVEIFNLSITANTVIEQWAYLNCIRLSSE